MLHRQTRSILAVLAISAAFYCTMASALAGSRSAEVAAIVGEGVPDTALTLNQFRQLAAAYRARRTQPPRDSTLVLAVYQEDPKLAEALVLYRDLDAETATVDAYLQYLSTTENAGVLQQPSARAHAAHYANRLLVNLDPALMPGENVTDVASLRQSLIYANRLRYGRDDVLPTNVFAFRDGVGYRLENAMWMAEMAALAYHDEDMVGRQLVIWGYPKDSFIWINDDNTDTQAFVIANEERIVVSFRGTAGLADFRTDAKFPRTDEGSVGGVHRGFQEALDGVWPDVKAALVKLRGGRPVYVTGHSLGAALAQLAAFRLQRTGSDVTAVYAYGSPLVGNRQYGGAYNDALGNRTYLHINNKDAVARIPPWWLGFSHVANAAIRKFPGRGHKIVLLEDPAALVQEDSAPVGMLNENGEIMNEAVAADELELRLAAASREIDQSTRYLRQPPDFLEGASYGTGFEIGGVDDHGIHQYLFKLGCANMDVIWAEENRRAGVITP